MTYPSRGQQIPAVVTCPDLPEYPLVIMCHGHGGSKEEHKGFDAIAQALCRAGIASIRMDFPGCGESAEPFTKNCLTNMKADVRAAAEYARANLPVTSISLFGYSMGGRISLELIAEGFAPASAVLLAPAASAKVMIDIFNREQSKFDELMATAQKNGYAELHIVGEVQTLSREWFRDLLAYDGDPTEKAAAAWHGPALVLYGNDDLAVPPPTPQNVAKALGAKLTDASGSGHSYGFSAQNPAFRENIAGVVADFFAQALCAR